MPHTFPSTGWVESLVAILNEDERYAHVARGWEGDLLFEIHPDRDGPGVGQGVQRVYLDLWHGRCRSGAYYEAASLNVPKAAFSMSATKAQFLRILSGELDPMQAMLTRKLQVVGSMGYILRNVPVVLDFVRCCRRVELPGQPTG